MDRILISSTKAFRRILLVVAPSVDFPLEVFVGAVSLACSGTSGENDPESEPGIIPLAAPLVIDMDNSPWLVVPALRLFALFDGRADLTATAVPRYVAL